MRILMHCFPGFQKLMLRLPKGNNFFTSLYAGRELHMLNLYKWLRVEDIYCF